MTRWITVAAAALALAACGSLDYHVVETGRRGPPYGGRVSVFFENQVAPEPFEEVAIVQAVGAGNQNRLEAALPGLAATAARLGCNAVVRVHVDQGAGQVVVMGVAGRVHGP